MLLPYFHSLHPFNAPASSSLFFPLLLFRSCIVFSFFLFLFLPVSWCFSLPVSSLLPLSHFPSIPLLSYLTFLISTTFISHHHSLHISRLLSLSCVFLYPVSFLSTFPTPFVPPHHPRLAFYRLPSVSLAFFSLSVFPSYPPLCFFSSLRFLRPLCIPSTSSRFLRPVICLLSLVFLLYSFRILRWCSSCPVYVSCFLVCFDVCFISLLAVFHLSSMSCFPSLLLCCSHLSSSSPVYVFCFLSMLQRLLYQASYRVSFILYALFSFCTVIL